MVRVTILYHHPKDPEAFERYYAEQHIPRYIDSAGIPGLVRFDAAKALPTSSDPPLYYRIADLWFENAEALQAARAMPVWQEGVKDLSNFATGGFEVLVSAVVTKELAIGRA